MTRMSDFFASSERLDHEVLRPLDHVRGNWETTWDPVRGIYKHEEDSYATDLNALIVRLSSCSPPTHYHDNEDRLAEYVLRHMRWPIKKIGRRWVGADYTSILENGAFADVDRIDLTLAAAGRAQAAIDRGQLRYDQMEDSHRRMLGAVMAIILFLGSPH